jgi:hypothetical protein
MLRRRLLSEEPLHWSQEGDSITIDAEQRLLQLNVPMMFWRSGVQPGNHRNHVTRAGYWPNMRSWYPALARAITIVRTD